MSFRECLDLFADDDAAFCSVVVHCSESEARHSVRLSPILQFSRAPLPFFHVNTRSITRTRYAEERLNGGASEQNDGGPKDELAVIRSLEQEQKRR